MNKNKKIFAIIMCLFMCLTVLNAPVYVNAEDVYEEETSSVGLKQYVKGEKSYVQFDESCINGKKIVRGTDIVIPVNVYSSGENSYIREWSFEWRLSRRDSFDPVYNTERYDFDIYESRESFDVYIPTENLETGEYTICLKTFYPEDSSRYLTFEIIDPVIKGKCQMPYTGAGGGYLIGVETYEDKDYLYEMLILDCTLLRDGKDAWVYTTGKCKVPDNCLWTIWQPQYGYYWTLFRVYDSSGVMLEEQCYGFVNAY